MCTQTIMSETGYQIISFQDSETNPCNTWFFSYKGEREGILSALTPLFLLTCDLGSLYWYATACLSLSPRFWFSWSHTRFNASLKSHIPLSPDSLTAFLVSWYSKGIYWAYFFLIDLVLPLWIAVALAAVPATYFFQNPVFVMWIVNMFPHCCLSAYWS